MKKKDNSKKVKKNNFKIIISLFWIFFILLLILFFGIFFAASIGYLGSMPDLQQLENPKTNLATQVITSDNKILGKYYFRDNRTPISFKEIPNNLVEALISTEDERFYSHSGIDWKSTLRAIVYMGKKGGASTITQQLARQLFVGVRSKNIYEAVIQKIKEWVLSVELERRYTKNEIISMYLNVYDFGYNADGLISAAKIYFNKFPNDLLIEESAMLVGMLKNSSLYNPIKRPERVKKRRDVVFNQMYRNKFINEYELDSLMRISLKIKFTPESHREGLATYFRTYLQEFMRDWIKNNPKEDGSFYNIYRDGLKIYTTIDSRLQKLGEDSVKKHMRNLQEEFFIQNDSIDSKTLPFIDLRLGQIDTVLNNSARRSDRWRNLKSMGMKENEILDSFKREVQMTVFSHEGEIDTLMSPMDSIRYYKKFLRASMMSMDPTSGHVKVWVGGFDYKHFQYDQVYQGRRQIGSTFKPFLYATAIDQLRLSPCDLFPDALYCIEPLKHGNVDAWCPKNSGERYGKTRTLKNALANSVNTVSARLMDKVGPRPVINLARKMGIKSKIPRVPSIALGTPDISLFEMVGAYSTFANKGIYIRPIVVTRIEDKNGKILFEIIPETRDVLSEESAYVTINLLKGVTEEGSGRRLRHEGAELNNLVYEKVVTGYPYKFENPIAGKTGTTQNQSDGWFLGMVPNLVTGVWVGGEDRSIHFRDIAYGQGATMALPIWGLFMQAIYEDEELNISKEDFSAPEKITIPIDCDKVFIDNTSKTIKSDDDFEEFGF
ncbi:MAG: transglycosylase domain-containing protein [Flavobacteriaceae bacterium]|nr:transglycosylase domain-containing protein [Flavobacteriaceae bacterium]